MKKYYECHITFTFPVGSLFGATDILAKYHWLYSAIDGDPDMGKGVRSYATKQFNERRSFKGIVAEMQKVSRALDHMGCTITRNKVEKVIFDERYK